MEKGFFYNKKTGEAFRCARTGHGNTGLSQWLIITPGEPCITLEEYCKLNDKDGNFILLTMDGELAPTLEMARWLCCYCEEDCTYAARDVNRMMDLGLDWISEPMSLTFHVFQDEWLQTDNDDYKYRFSVYDNTKALIFRSEDGCCLWFVMTMIDNVIKILDRAAGINLCDKVLHTGDEILEKIDEKYKKMFTSINE